MFYAHHFGQNKGERQRTKEGFFSMHCSAWKESELGAKEGRIWLRGFQKKEVWTEAINQKYGSFSIFLASIASKIRAV